MNNSNVWFKFAYTIESGLLAVVGQMQILRVSPVQVNTDKSLANTQISWSIS